MPAPDPASEAEILREGGCKCGRLRYRVFGQPRAVNACHCRDCQRLTGSAFAVNAMFATSAVEELGTTWTDADRVGIEPGNRQWRCVDCGVLLYADHPLFGDATRFIRVGTLDEGRELEPDAHYFVRSKHPWVVIPQGVPRFDTLPDRPVIGGQDVRCR
ncbi:GFA family protein [Tianweitania sediminis]|uniref:GFA family protein n=1 Tax=Tianweitania sediminis TaxID=1502156 RepID=A0A8J7R0F7_9HYPH|nr:GFA family protein [Tianweitania sediminis]MBP0438298.1 GFA family protein [Tianweitania sediminis]